MKETFPLALHAPEPPVPWSYWVVEGCFLAGAFPGSPGEVKARAKTEALLNAGIRTFINLMEAEELDHGGAPFAPYAEGVREAARERGVPVACLRFPVRDLNVPSRETALSVLDALDLSLAAARPVYLHCWGGVGRTGTLVSCWLLRHGYAAPEEVLPLLKTLRAADSVRRHRDSPETAAQRAFVLSWEEGSGQ